MNYRDSAGKESPKIPGSRKMALSLLLSLLTLVGAVGISSAQEAALTIEDLLSLRVVTTVRLSPAGDQIAYLLRVPRQLYEEDDGPPHHELHVVDLDGVSRPYVTGEVDITDIAWARDSGSIFFLAQRDPDADFNSLHQIHLSGGEAKPIFTHASSIQRIYPAPDGTKLAFTATEAPPEKHEELEAKGFKAVVYEESVQPVKVWMLDLTTKSASAHDLPGSASDFSWSADSQQYAVALAPTPHIDDFYMARDIYVIGAESGEVQNRMNLVGKLGHFDFSPDGKHIAYIGGEDLHDPLAGRLYLTPTAGGERRELVPEYLGHVWDFVWMDDSHLRWLGARGVWTEWAIASVMSPAPAGPEPKSGPIVYRVHGHPGVGVAAAIADTPEHPSEVYLLRDGAAPLRLTDSNPWLGDRRLGKQEVIAYQARDGLELEAILIHPVEPSRGRSPLIIVAHGGPEGHYSHGWMTYYGEPGQVLATHGYTVVFPNYRGSTGKGVAFSKLDQHDYAEEEFNDLVDAKHYLVDGGLCDGKRVGITGGSYGGYAAMWSASALSEEYAAAVAFVGISNQISKFGTTDIPNEMFNVHARAWPWDDWMWMLERSPVFHAGKTKTPLLIMAGDQDPRVHPSQSLEMYRNVKLRTDTPVRLVFYPGEGHGNRNTAARYDYALRLLRWMDHYLKGPGGAPPPYELDHASKLTELSE